jgi:hypothetical protein
MKILRGVVTALYLAFVMFIFYTIFSEAHMPRWWFFSRLHALPLKYSITYACLFVFTQAGCVMATTAGSLTSDIDLRALAIPSFTGSVMITAILTALYATLEDMLGVQANLHTFIGIIFLNLAAWFVFFYIRYYRNPRFRVLRNLAFLVLLSGLFELAVSSIAHLSVRGRIELMLYHPGISTSLSILTGLTVILWTAGPGIFVAFLGNKYDQEYKEFKDKGGHSIDEI